MEDLKSFEDKLKPVKGYFSIETYDKNDNLINFYEDRNKIMARVPYTIVGLFYGSESRGYNNELPPNTPASDLAIGTIAIGTDGIDSAGFEREIECNRDMLFSEKKLWEGKDLNTNSNSLEDINKFVYQTSFSSNIPNEQNPEELVKASKITEGPSFPWDSSENKPLYYRADSTNNDFEDTSMTVKSSMLDGYISYEFTLGQFAGNGIWTQAPAFSEAALYMKYIPASYATSVDDGRPLGALFSMKTFPKQFKTEACYFRIKWKLIFGTESCDL